MGIILTYSGAKNTYARRWPVDHLCDHIMYMITNDMCKHVSDPW